MHIFVVFIMRVLLCLLLAIAAILPVPSVRGGILTDFVLCHGSADEAKVKHFLEDRFHNDEFLLSSIDTKYGSLTGPFSFSSGPLGVVNSTIVGTINSPVVLFPPFIANGTTLSTPVNYSHQGLMQADILAYWLPRVSPQFRYTEYISNGALLYDIQNNTALIAHLLVKFAVDFKVYGQEMQSSHVFVKDDPTDNDRFIVYNDITVINRLGNPALFPPFAPVYPTLANQTIGSLLLLRITNVYERTCTISSGVDFRMVSTHRANHANYYFSSPIFHSSLPYSDFPGARTEYPE